MEIHARMGRAAGLATLALIGIAVLVAGIADRQLSSETRSAPERARGATYWQLVATRRGVPEGNRLPLELGS